MIAVHEAVVGRPIRRAGRPVQDRGRGGRSAAGRRSSSVSRRWTAAGCSTWVAARGGLPGA